MTPSTPVGGALEPEHFRPLPLVGAPLVEPDEIQIWAVDLDPPAAEIPALWRLLAPDEVERANRFRFDEHRRRYAVGRAALRRILARDLGTAPERVGFDYGPRGKPFLAAAERTGGGAGLEFNLSNSSDLALVALVRGPELGVDVERLKPMPDADEIAERFFSASERDVLRTLGPELKAIGFFNAWTRKEAYLKAVGEGLAAPLDSFDVTLAPQEPPRMLTLRGDREAAARWHYRHLFPQVGYVGALAIEGAAPSGRDWTVSGWRWAP